MASNNAFLKQLREQSGIPIHALASAAGISVEQITKYENDLCEISPRMAERVVSAINALRKRGW